MNPESLINTVVVAKNIETGQIASGLLKKVAPTVYSVGSLLIESKNIQILDNRTYTENNNDCRTVILS